MSRVEWQDVLRAMPRTETRNLVLGMFKDGGFSADSFSNARTGAGGAKCREARIAMADALTAAEDWIETVHPRWEEDRKLLRAVRRRLELELWP